jgi:diaminopimelate decarboxylase
MVNEAAWQLERRDARLWWGGCSLSDLAAEHGTPLFVVNTALLDRARRSLLGPFEAERLPARLFFSVKTNPVPAVLRHLAALGCGAEVISEFEFWLARQVGFDGPGIVVTGPAKTPRLLREAVAGGAALVNVETIEELRSLSEVAADIGRRARIGLRVNPCLPKSLVDFTVSSGTRASHAGFRLGGAAWSEALGLLRADRWLDLTALHFHLGSGIRSATPYLRALEAVLGTWAHLLDRGFAPSVLDIGGGFAAPTVKAFDLFEAIRFFGWNRPPAGPAASDANPLPGQVARALGGLLRGHGTTAGAPAPTIYLEPGRALVAASQLLLLGVTSIRPRPRGAPVAICDAGAMSLSPLLLTERHEVFPVCAAPDRSRIRYDIVGNLPAPLDLVALRQDLPALAPGDVIAVMDVGAYFTSLGNTFAGPRPPIVMIDRGTARLARRRETWSDLVLRDVTGAG